MHLGTVKFLAHFLTGGQHAVREGVDRPRAPPDFAAMRSMELLVRMRSQCSCWKPTYMILCPVKPEAELGQARRFSSSGLRQSRACNAGYLRSQLLQDSPAKLSLFVGRLLRWLERIAATALLQHEEDVLYLMPYISLAGALQEHV